MTCNGETRLLGRTSANRFLGKAAEQTVLTNCYFFGIYINLYITIY